MMYPFAQWFAVPSTAYISLISLNLFIGLTCTLVTFTLDAFPDDAGLRDANAVLKWMFCIFPPYCLGRGMLDLARNEYTTQINQIVNPDYAFQSPFGMKIIGRNLIFMFLEGLIFVIIIIIIEHQHVKIKRVPPNLAPKAIDADTDVQQEVDFSL